MKNVFFLLPLVLSLSGLGCHSSPEQVDPLLDAVRLGDVEAVEHLLSSEFYARSSGENLEVALHQAAAAGDLGIIEVLLEGLARLRAVAGEGTKLGPVPDLFTAFAFNLRIGATKVQGPGGVVLDPISGLTKAGEYLAHVTDGTLGLVGLQEVDEKTRDSACIAQAENLGRMVALGTSSPWTGRFTQAYVTATQRCSPDHDPQRGIAILTNIDHTKVQEHAFVWSSDAPTDDVGVRRMVATAIKVVFPGGRWLWFVNTHLDGHLDGKIAMQQIFELLGHIKRFDPDLPVVLVGDLNIRSDHPENDNLERYLLRLRQAMPAALFEDALPPGHRLRMHVWFYDPHDELSVVQAELLDPVLEASDGAYRVSDHEVPAVTFLFR